MPTLETEKVETPAAEAPTTTRKRAPRKRKSAAKSDETAPETAAAPAAQPAPQPEVAPEAEPEEEFSPALLFLEDFVVTSLLSAGHSLQGDPLAERAEGWSLPVGALDEALKNSRRVRHDEDGWNLVWHSARRGQSRDERARSPIEALIRELLLAVGKPLPVPVIAREVALMLNSRDANLKNTVAGIIKTLRWAIAIAPGVYLHEDWMLRAGAPNDELLIRENHLSRDPDFQGLREFAEITQTAPAAIARELLEFTGGPLNQKVIGFFVHRAAHNNFAPRELAATLNDRAQFQPLIDGFVTLQEQLPDLKSQTQEWLEELVAPSDTEALPSSSVEASANGVAQPAGAPIGTEVAGEAPVEAPLPATNVAAQTGEDEDKAMQTQEAPVSADAPESQTPADPTPEALELAARGADVPPYVGVVPETLLPIALQISDPKTGEPFDFALDDAGLDDDAAQFVHAPQWEDIGEEIEVAEVPAAPDKAPTVAKIVMLNHHIRSGTVKIRSLDRHFFGMEEPFLQLKFHDSEDDENLEVWVARAIGIVYEMGQWFDENLPPSGGTIKFERTDDGIEISVDRPDAETFLTPRRLHELEDLRPSSVRMSLFELLSRLVEDHPAGMTLPALWAEVNVVRRTSKRLMASVLSSYGVFSIKEGRNKEMLWFYDKTGGGFKEEKRPFIRR